MTTIDMTKPVIINKIKFNGLQNEARNVLGDIKDRGMKIVDLMEDTPEGDDQDGLAAVLGGLTIQSTAIEMALQEGALTLEHKPLITAAINTVKDVDSFFKPRKSNAHR